MFLGSPLLNPNAYVTIQTWVASQAAGGTIYGAGATVATGVPVIATLFHGARDERFDTDWNGVMGTLSGESSALGRQDVTVVFSSASLAGIPDGIVARLVDVTSHPASPDGWLPERFTGRFEVIASGVGP
jgi:hypothetical protein